MQGLEYLNETHIRERISSSEEEGETKRGDKGAYAGDHAVYKEAKNKDLRKRNFGQVPPSRLAPRQILPLELLPESLAHGLGATRRRRHLSYTLKSLCVCVSRHQWDSYPFSLVLRR